MQAGLPILLRHGPLQPGLGELSDASKEKAGGKENPSKKKEVSPRQPSAIGNPAVTETALSTAGGGRPCCPPPEGEAACWHLQAPGKEISPLCPVSHPTDHQGREKLIAEHRGGSSRSLPTVTYIYTDAATGEHPWHCAAVLENISGARRAGVPPAPRQAAVHGGPCLPGPAIKPPTTRGPYFKRLCSSYSSLSYCVRYSPTKQSSSTLRI